MEWCRRCGKPQVGSRWCPGCHREVCAELAARQALPPGCPPEADVDRGTLLSLFLGVYLGWFRGWPRPRLGRSRPPEDMSPWQENALRIWEDGAP